MKKLSMNAICFILAGCIAVGFPCYQALATNTNISTTKRNGSGLKSTGNVEYYDKATGRTVTVFDVTDLYYLENRIEDVLNSQINELQNVVK